MSSVAVINPNHGSIDVWMMGNGTNMSLNLKHSFEITGGARDEGQARIRVLRIAFELDDSLFVECLSADAQNYYLLSMPVGSRGVGPCITHVHIPLGKGLSPRGASVLLDNNDRSSYPWIFLLFGESGTYVSRSLAAPLSRTVSAPSSSSTFSPVELVIRRPTSTARQLNRLDRNIFLAIVEDRTAIAEASSSSSASSIQSQWLYLWHVEKGPLWRTPLHMNVVDVLVLPTPRSLSYLPNTNQKTVNASRGGEGREVVLDSDSDDDDDDVPVDRDTARCRTSTASASVAVEPTSMSDGGYFHFNEVTQAAAQESQPAARTRFQLQVSLAEMAKAGVAAGDNAGIPKLSLLQNLQNLREQLHESVNGAVWRHLSGCLVVTADDGDVPGTTSRLRFLQCDLMCVTADARPRASLPTATTAPAPATDKENCNAARPSEATRDHMLGRYGTAAGTAGAGVWTGAGAGVGAGHLLHRSHTLPATPTTAAMSATTSSRPSDDQSRPATIATSDRRSSNPYHRGALMAPPPIAPVPSTTVDIALPSAGASSDSCSTLLLIPRKFNQRLFSTRLAKPDPRLDSAGAGAVSAQAPSRVVACDRCMYPSRYSFYWTQDDEEGWTVAHQIEFEP